jgi:hypothetical protein
MDPDRFKADRWWNVVAGAGGLIAAERVNDFETPFVMRLASERICD